MALSAYAHAGYIAAPLISTAYSKAYVGLPAYGAAYAAAPAYGVAYGGYAAPALLKAEPAIDYYVSTICLILYFLNAGLLLIFN